jgi:hypothetical protein
MLEKFFLWIQGSVNKIDRFVTKVPGTINSSSYKSGDLMYYGVDANVKYSFMN